MKPPACNQQFQLHVVNHLRCVNLVIAVYFKLCIYRVIIIIRGWTNPKCPRPVNLVLVSVKCGSHSQWRITQSREKFHLKVKVKYSPILDYECWAWSWSRFLGSQPAGDISHKPGDRLPLLSTRPMVTSPAKEITPLAGAKLYCLVTEAHYRCK